MAIGLSKLKIIAIAVVVIFVLVLLGSVLTYNAIVSRDQDAKKTWGNIEAACQMRMDNIPAVLNAVNSSMIFEKSLLEKITFLRTQ
jgi:LemA protein